MNKNKKEPIIKWQKWVDPFGLDTDESEWTDYENNESIVNHLLDDGSIEDTYDEQNKPPIKKTHKTIKVIASPMGIIPYTEHTACSKIFNFWTGHTNFNLSKSIVECIEKSEGVETLDIFTRYRFRIAIGKCFNEAETMSDISHAVYSILKI